MKIQDLLEAISPQARAPLYHSTSLRAAFDILKSRRIHAGHEGYVSLTRDPRLNYAAYNHDDLSWHDKRSGPPVYVTFVIDQNILRHNVRVSPYNWGAANGLDDMDDFAGGGKAESEEHVAGDVPLKAISGIIIPKRSMRVERVQPLLKAARLLGLTVTVQ